MSLFNSLKSKKFDKRVVEWNLRNGVITKAEYDEYVKSLSDEETKAETTVVFNDKNTNTDLQ